MTRTAILALGLAAGLILLALGISMLLRQPERECRPVFVVMDATDFV